MFKAKGRDHSYALLPISGTPPPNLTGVGSHAISFAGEVKVPGDVAEFVRYTKDNSDDSDSPISWDLDIDVGPSFRILKAVAPFVAVTHVQSTNADSDDYFEHSIRFRNPAWSPQIGDPRRIILHVTVRQMGEGMHIMRLSYSAMATGTLVNPEQFVS